MSMTGLADVSIIEVPCAHKLATVSIIHMEQAIYMREHA